MKFSVLILLSVAPLLCFGQSDETYHSGRLIFEKTSAFIEAGERYIRRNGRRTTPGQVVVSCARQKLH